ncbi:MAG TPA: hypothetical protein VMY80_00890 [Anaerolineae bacterium]|nr:hypothetical protein [Anaerolineae bacterium]
MEQTKQCATCGRDLPRSSFYRDRRKSDGLYSECKDCVKARRTRDIAKRRKWAREWRAANPDLARQRDAEYYQEHKEERNEAQRRYRAKRKGQADA